MTIFNNLYIDITDIRAYEPKNNNAGAEITFSTTEGRKTFHLPKPCDPQKTKPLAIESFAIEPDTYFEWMNAIQKLHSSNES